MSCLLSRSESGIVDFMESTDNQYVERLGVQLTIEKVKTPFEVKYTSLNLEGYTPISSKSGHISFLWRFSS